MRQPILLLILTLLLPAAAHTKRPFTIADQYRIVEVSDPDLSPDGRWIAYVTTHHDLEANEKWSHIWLVESDGKGRRQLTQARALNTSPRFSPTGHQLAFLSKRGALEAQQLFLLPLAGGEPRKLTDFPGGVRGPLWSPDGNTIAVTASVYPACGADIGCNRDRRERRKNGPLKAHVTDKLLYRHWDTWRDGLYDHILLFSVQDGSFHDLTPGPYDAPGFSLSGGRGYDFAPDGNELAFSSNHDPNPAETTNSDLFVVELRHGKPAGKPVRITTNPAWDGNPAYARDGETIAYRTQKIPGYEADRFRIALYARKTRHSRVFTEKFDNWVTGFHWERGSRSIVFRALHQGRTPLYRIQVQSGRIDPVVRYGHIDSFVRYPKYNSIVFTSGAVARPPELFSVSDTGRGLRQLSRHNAPLLREVDFRPVEERWVKSADGKKIHVFLVKPHGFDPRKKYPLILKVHGGPQGMYGDRYVPDFQIFPGLGYVLAYTNPTGSTGYGQAFTRAISRDWGGKVYKDLMKVVDDLERLPYVDRRRMGAMGWSYGGYMMMWFEGHTDRFKALAAMMGIFDLASKYGATEELWFPEFDLGGTPWESDDYRKWSPSMFVKNFKTPCLVIGGEQDFRVPYTQSLQFFTALQKMGVPSRLAVLAEAGHVPEWYDMVLYYLLHADWFHRHLGGEPAPWVLEKFLQNELVPVVERGGAR